MKNQLLMAALLLSVLLTDVVAQSTDTKTPAKPQTSTSTIEDFDVEGIFQKLATKDYERAVELARGFQGEGPRAVATIAIARAILEPKKVKEK